MITKYRAGNWQVADGYLWRKTWYGYRRVTQCSTKDGIWFVGKAYQTRMSYML